MSKLLTIIVPCFLRKLGIKRLLDSIDPALADVILIDDGSKEVNVFPYLDNDLLPYLYELSHNYSNVKVLTKEHSGIYNTRVMGTDFVKTPYFMFVDSDDRIVSKNVQKLCQNMNDNDCDMGIGRLYFKMCGFGMCSRKKWTECVHSFQKDIDIEQILNVFHNKIFSTKMIPVLKEMPHNTTIFEDTAPVFLTSLSANNIFISHDIIHNYLFRTDNLSFFSSLAKSDNQLGIQDLYTMFLDGKKYAIEKGFFPTFKLQYESMFIRLFLQRIKATYNSKVLPKDQKERLVNQILNLMTSLIPNWQQNSYYLAGFSKCELNDIYNSWKANQILKTNEYYKKKEFLISKEDPEIYFEKYKNILEEVKRSK